jgi:ANTAR domain
MPKRFVVYSSDSRDTFGLLVAEQLTVVARELHGAEGHQATLKAAVRLARETVPGAEYAGITLFERNRKLRTAAWTDEVVRAVHAGEEAADLGLKSVLPLRLDVGRPRDGVLNLYSTRPEAFDTTAVRIGQLLTTHITIALESAAVQEQLTEAMHTRDVIGQATGVLMTRLRMDAASAFDWLVRTSQTENVKLRDIAYRIVEAAEEEAGNDSPDAAATDEAG